MKLSPNPKNHYIIDMCNNRARYDLFFHFDSLLSREDIRSGVCNTQEEEKLTRNWTNSPIISSSSWIHCFCSSVIEGPSSENNVCARSKSIQRTRSVSIWTIMLRGYGSPWYTPPHECSSEQHGVWRSFLPKTSTDRLGVCWGCTRSGRHLGAVCHGGTCWDVAGILSDRCVRSLRRNLGRCLVRIIPSPWGADMRCFRRWKGRLHGREGRRGTFLWHDIGIVEIKKC